MLYGSVKFASVLRGESIFSPFVCYDNWDNLSLKLEKKYNILSMHIFKNMASQSARQPDGRIFWSLRRTCRARFCCCESCGRSQLMTLRRQHQLGETPKNMLLCTEKGWHYCIYSTPLKLLVYATSLLHEIRFTREQRSWLWDTLLKTQTLPHTPFALCFHSLPNVPSRPPEPGNSYIRLYILHTT